MFNIGRWVTLKGPQVGLHFRSALCNKGGLHKCFYGVLRLSGSWASYMFYGHSDCQQPQRKGCAEHGNLSCAQ